MACGSSLLQPNSELVQLDSRARRIEQFAAKVRGCNRQRTNRSREHGELRFRSRPLPVVSDVVQATTWRRHVGAVLAEMIAIGLAFLMRGLFLQFARQQNPLTRDTSHSIIEVSTVITNFDSERTILNCPIQRVA